MRDKRTEWNIREVEALDWNIRGRSGPGVEPPGLHKEKEAAAARKGKSNMNKSKERWRGRTRRTRVGKREKKERKEKRTSTWKPDWNIRGRNAHGLEHPVGGGPRLEHLLIWRPEKRRALRAWRLINSYEGFSSRELSLPFCCPYMGIV